MNDYLYDNYILRLSQRFRAELETVKAIYNFDLGDEYEIAICRVLRHILPLKYGICRGFVVANDGTKAGDDIIIYDSNRFPSIGFRDYNDFSRKEFIPIEAVYGYIEAKYTLDLSDSKSENLSKALSQINDVKEICNKRQAVQINQFENLVLDTVIAPWDFPPIKNQSWAAIFCSRIKYDGRILESPEEIEKILKGKAINTLNRPDLIVFGSNVIGIPIFQNQPKHGVDTLSQFYINGKTGFKTLITEDKAEGIGICQLFAAFDKISLGQIKWANVVFDAMTKK
jgi:hypothetical protein